MTDEREVIESGPIIVAPRMFRLYGLPVPDEPVSYAEFLEIQARAREVKGQS